MTYIVAVLDNRLAQLNPIFFIQNTHVHVREKICTELDIHTEALSDNYLGLPTTVGVDRSDCFQHIIDRIC